MSPSGYINYSPTGDYDAFGSIVRQQAKTITQLRRQLNHADASKNRAWKREQKAEARLADRTEAAELQKRLVEATEDSATALNKIVAVLSVGLGLSPDQNFKISAIMDALYEGGRRKR